MILRAVSRQRMCCVMLPLTAAAARVRARTGFLHAHHTLPRRLQCRSRNQAGSGCRARNDSRIPRAYRRFRQRNHRQAGHRTRQGGRAQSRSFVWRRNREIRRAFVRRLTDPSGPPGPSRPIAAVYRPDGHPSLLRLRRTVTAMRFSRSTSSETVEPRVSGAFFLIPATSRRSQLLLRDRGRTTEKDRRLRTHAVET